MNDINIWKRSKIQMAFATFIGIAMDQLSKYYARSQNIEFDSNFISLYFYKNTGFALGSLSSTGASNVALFSGLLYCVIASFLIILIASP